MDCRHAADVLSAALDGDAVSPISVAQARDHCTGCPECASMLATMERMAAVPHIRVPAHVVSRILETVHSEAAARSDEDDASTYAAPASGVVLPLEPVRARRRTAPTWWKPSYAPLVSAAAVVLVVSAVSTYALMRMTGAPSEYSGADSVEIALRDDGAMPESARAGDLAAPAGATAETASAAAVSAPPYLVWSGTVWVRTDGTAPPESTLSSAGATATDLGEPSGPMDRDVLSGPGEPGVIYVRSSDGSLMRFTRVVRTLGGRTYALVTEGVIDRFGVWPTLPSRFPAPTGTDGSPTFVLQGFDDRGREVYVPEGTKADQGFAVAPGTPADDPAAGNPSWTWWQPVD